MLRTLLCATVRDALKDSVGALADFETLRPTATGRFALLSAVQASIDKQRAKLGGAIPPGGR